MTFRRRNKGIPDRWLDYSPMKDVMKDVKIVPFKAPLPIRNFDDNYLVRYKWTPSDVMQRVPDLGLVIDLTYKNPCYYEPIEFLENGVDYVKIKCPGRVIPPQELFIEFCKTIDDFLSQHPDLVVGVHCTHGVNRTGYMICRYMVERCGYDAKEAVNIFAEIRGHAIERENYIKEIHNK